jgi:hypothetical protein
MRLVAPTARHPSCSGRPPSRPPPQVRVRQNSIQIRTQYAPAEPYRVSPDAEVDAHRMLLFVNGFATSRTLSMKRRAVALRARFFRVTIPAGPDCSGRLTGKILGTKFFALNCRTVRGNIAKNGPDASKALIMCMELVVTAACGTSKPHRSKISAIKARGAPSGGVRSQGSSSS